MSLRFVGLKPNSLKSYKSALSHFFEWMEQEHLPMPSSSARLDENVASFLNHLWLDDISITYAGHTLSALRRFLPQLRFKLPVARQFFSNWKSVHVPQQAVPMPASVALALAGVALAVDEEELALRLLLGFTAFLRTGEITSLTSSRIRVNVRSGQVILALPATKTSKQKLESVAVVDPLLAALADHVLSRCPGRFSGALTPNSFRAQLKLLLATLGLTHYNFSGYSLRRGGASHAFATGKHFDALLVMGRWQSVKTARQYLDSGRAAAFSAETLRTLDHFQEVATSFCRQLRKRRTSQR